MVSAYVVKDREELWTAGLVTTYRVRPPSGGSFALRVLDPEAPRAAFLHESALLRELSHPHIVPLLEAGEVAGALYQVHPDVDGTLEQRLDSWAPLPVVEALAIVRSIADALAHLHARRLVHCNLSPAAIWFVAGQPMLSRLELATPVGTVQNTPQGTSAFMSPEQARPGCHIEPAIDVYALGALLSAMLRSRRTRNPVLSAGLAEAIRKALAPTPAERFGTMAEFLRALAAA